MAHILALDQGTTSSRAIVFDERGAIVHIAQREFAQHFPRPGWVEHDPREVWESQRAVAVEAVERSGVGAGAIAALGITNQRETVVVWDRATGQPIHNAIVWQDRRTARDCDRLRGAGHAALIRERTGLVPDAYFSATKIAWLLDNVDGARARAERGELACGTIDSWLIWHLTRGGRHITDASNASRTMLYNIRSGQWDDELLGLFKVPGSMLPEVVPSSGEVGRTSAGVLPVELPIAGIAGDQQSALFGQTCFEAGSAKNTYGTGCFMLMNTGERPARSDHGLLSTIAWRVGDAPTYALEGAVFVAGAAVQWLRDGLGVIGHASEVEPLAASVDDSGGVVFVPALAGLGAPHWDQDARGLICGLTRGATRAHLARAALEGIAMQVVDVAHAMEGDAGLSLAELRVDGGACANDLLMQLQADLLGVPVVRPRVTESTALGAAYLAGLATGVWGGPSDLRAHAEIDRAFEPEMSSDRAESIKSAWRRAIERTRGA